MGSLSAIYFSFVIAFGRPGPRGAVGGCMINSLAAAAHDAHKSNRSNGSPSGPIQKVSTAGTVLPSIL
jgi:hypothetical protein